MLYSFSYLTPLEILFYWCYYNREIVNEMQKRVITMKKGIIISDEEKGGYIDED